MKDSRRNFLKIAGVSVLGLGIFPVFNLFALEKSIGKEKFYTRMKDSNYSGKTKQWCMVVNTKLIKSSYDLKLMMSACNDVHNIPTKLRNKKHEVKWIWQEKFFHAFPEKINNFLNKELECKVFPVLCNHCEKPACVRACPTKATFKRSHDGIVLMDFHRCIGCRFCMAACPFGARSFNFRDPRPFIEVKNDKFPTRMKGVVEKCNFCAERLVIGKKPACVEISNGILTFGDLRDPSSEVRKLLKENYTIRRKQTLGTGPSVYYIV